jgi:hypothetical protein
MVRLQLLAIIVSPSVSDMHGGTSKRIVLIGATDVCYKPDEYLSDDAREEKKELFEKGWVTVSLRGPDSKTTSLLEVVEPRPHHLHPQARSRRRVEHQLPVRQAEAQREDAQGSLCHPLLDCIAAGAGRGS